MDISERIDNNFTTGPRHKFGFQKESFFFCGFPKHFVSFANFAMLMADGTQASARVPSSFGLRGFPSDRGGGFGFERLIGRNNLNVFVVEVVELCTP